VLEQETQRGLRERGLLGFIDNCSVNSVTADAIVVRHLGLEHASVQCRIVNLNGSNLI
jgi:hypothetical protein